MSSEPNRRRFQRVQAPVLYRPLGMQFLRPAQQPLDISQGGLRVYSDSPMSPGDRLEIELFPPDGSSIVCEVEIVWIDPLPAGAPAGFDIGMKFLHEGTADLERLALVLEKSPATSA